MPNRAHRRSKVNLYRASILAAVALVLTAFSFHGALDDFAHAQVVETTNESIGIYVISRVINALVSVLQTSQVNVPLLASAQVGEMLDPVNDAVERLSSIVVWAVGSLFLQRILLEIAASPAFKWILCSIGLVTAASLLLLEWGRFRILCHRILSVSDSNLERCRDWIVRMFVVAAIVRFIVPSFIASSFLVSQIFLATEITENREKLSLLRTQAAPIASSPSPEGQDLEEQRVREEAKLNAHEESMASAKREIQQLEEAIDKLNDETGWLRRYLPKRLGGASPGEELLSRKSRWEEVDREMDRIEDRISESRSSLECIERRIAGGTCGSLLERVSKAGTAGISHVKEMSGKFNDMVTDITMLLVAIAIKNILFPILFLLGAVKCSLPVARHASRLLSGFERDSKKLKGMMKQLKGPVRQLERHGSQR